MTTLPPTLSLRQRAFALAASVVLTSAVCVANLGMAQGYAAQGASAPGQASTAQHAVSTACTQSAARS